MQGLGPTCLTAELGLCCLSDSAGKAEALPKREKERGQRRPAHPRLPGRARCHSSPKDTSQQTQGTAVRLPGQLMATQMTSLFPL